MSLASFLCQASEEARLLQKDGNPEQKDYHTGIMCIMAFCHITHFSDVPIFQCVPPEVDAYAD